MPMLGERIESLEAKLKALKMKQLRIDARAHALSSRRARKDDTRRKILGVTILARIDSHQLDHAKLESWLNAHLTQGDDRALFQPSLKASVPLRNGRTASAESSAAKL